MKIKEEQTGEVLGGVRYEQKFSHFKLSKIYPLEFNFKEKNYRSNGKIILPISKFGDMKYITINIGGKDYDFLIDTGASDMLINSKVEQHLLDAGVLRKDDYTEPRIYEIANGQKVRFKRAKLYSAKIGGEIFKDINIAIGDKSASLLLGMSFLNKFNWKFKDNTLELIAK